MLEDLHAPMLPILRHVLAQAPLPHTGTALDLACGPGDKLGLLAEAFGPGVRIIGVDRGAAAARSYLDGGRRAKPVVGAMIGDAGALPLRDRSLDAAVCIAALGLFERPAEVVRGLGRALRPGAPALFVTASQQWAQVIPWPAELAARLVEAAALGGRRWPEWAGSPDLGGDLRELLAAGRLAGPQCRAFLLEPAADPAHLELPLVPWRALRSRAAPRLSAGELVACDEVARQADAELVAAALVVLAFGR